MLGQEFMRNALLAGTFVALACGVSGWFVVLRGQVFAGDALSHVAFPGALAAAAAGVDQRIGLFVATIAAGAAIGMLGRGVLGGGRGGGAGGVGTHGGGGGGAAAAQDTAIGIAFTFILGLGVFFLALAGTSAAGASGIAGAHTLFGSIFGLSAGEARLAAAIGLGAVLATAAIARPLLFSSVAPDVAAARGVPTRLLAIAFVALLGVVAAEATQAVGALLLLGLLAAPAAAAHRLTRAPLAGIALAGLLAVAATWGGLVLAYEIPSLPPSTAIVALAVGAYGVAALLSGRPHR
jgi:zinc/manganese transport system permease protein